MKNYIQNASAIAEWLAAIFLIVIAFLHISGMYKFTLFILATVLIFILSFMLYIFLQKKCRLSTLDICNYNVMPSIVSKMSNISYFILFILLIIPYDFNYFIFIFIVGICCFVILGDIIFLNQSSYIVLLKIYLLSILISSKLYFSYPSLIGIDPWFHVNFINSMIEQNIIPKIFSYEYFPLSHIYVAISALITGLFDLKNIYFILCVVERFSVFFVYLFVLSVSNKKIGLISSLFFSMLDYTILWSYYLIPLSVEILYFTFLLFLLFKINKNNYVQHYLISLIIITSIIGTHHLSSVIISVSMFIIYSTNFLFKFSKERRIVGIIKFFALGFIAYWIRLTEFLQFAYFQLISVDAISYYNSGKTMLSGYYIIWTYFPLLFLQFFIIMGVLYNLHLKAFKKTQIDPMYLISSIITMIIFVLIYVANLSSLLPARWIVFFYVISIPYFSYGLLFITSSIPTNKLKIFFLLVVVIFFVHINLTADKSNVDNIFDWSERPIPALKNSELTAGETILNNFNVNNELFVDSYYHNFFQYNTNHKKLKLNDASLILSEKSTDYDFLILRGQFLSNAIWITDTKQSYQDEYVVNSSFYHSLMNKSIIYDNKDIILIRHD